MEQRWIRAGMVRGRGRVGRLVRFRLIGVFIGWVIGLSHGNPAYGEQSDEALG